VTAAGKVMRRIVLDASALAAMTFHEPDNVGLEAQVEDTSVHAPYLLKLEMANVALIKARRQPDAATEILTALHLALDDSTGIVWHDVDATDVALMAQATGLSAYDASYLWLAGTLDADLVTLDRKLAAALET
jgi:predicted nucleic acid-binding protein